MSGFKKICTTTINGKRWVVGYGYTGKTDGKINDGLCVYSKRRIILQSKENGRKSTIIDVGVHELLHAYLMCLNEDSVNEFGELCGRVLPKLMAAEADK
jgi:hypothetical protein